MSKFIAIACILAAGLSLVNCAGRPCNEWPGTCIIQ